MEERDGKVEDILIVDKGALLGGSKGILTTTRKDTLLVKVPNFDVVNYSPFFSEQTQERRQDVWLTDRYVIIDL